MKAIKKKLFFSFIFLCSNVVATQKEVTQLATQYGFVASTSNPIFDDNGFTALTYVINLNSSNVLIAVKALIKVGANVNLADNRGYTPLLYATDNSSTYNVLEIVQALITAGADVNKAGNGINPLTLAIDNNNLDMVNALIKAKAKVDLVYNDGSTPLLNTIFDGNNLGIVNALIKAGANVNLVAKDGSTPLGAAIDAIYVNKLDFVNALIKAGANVNLADNSGYTPLLGAIYNNNVEIVQALITAKANVNLADKDGITPLELAVYVNNLEMVNALIKVKAKIILIKGKQETYSNILTKIDAVLQKYLSVSTSEFLQRVILGKIDAAQKCKPKSQCQAVKDAYSKYLAKKSVA